MCPRWLDLDNQWGLLRCIGNTRTLLAGHSHWHRRRRGEHPWPQPAADTPLNLAADGTTASLLLIDRVKISAAAKCGDLGPFWRGISATFPRFQTPSSSVCLGWDAVILLRPFCVSLRQHFPVSIFVLVVVEFVWGAMTTPLAPPCCHWLSYPPSQRTNPIFRVNSVIYLFIYFPLRARNLHRSGVDNIFGLEIYPEDRV